jgi:AcrR family transcriptional regulator
MNDARDEQSLRKGVRKGTAQRRAGKETAGRLVSAARELLESESLERFSMRNVAERAGVSLANLQYYFPRRTDLVQAMYLDLDSRYRASFADFLGNDSDTSRDRLEFILRFLIEDITHRKTRQFFIQFWALLGSLDDFRCEQLGRVYDLEITQLSEHIEALCPSISAAEVRSRATLISALIEGLMVVMGAVEEGIPFTTDIQESALKLAMVIAVGEVR